jgi:hypothetical protein
MQIDLANLQAVDRQRNSWLIMEDYQFCGADGDFCCWEVIFGDDPISQSAMTWTICVACAAW